MYSRTLLVAASSLLVTPAASVRADVRPNPLFSDNMVLQQGERVPVWGHADAGEEVTVEFLGRKATARAGGDGRWRVELESLEAGGPHEMTIRGKNTVTIRNVLVGEVWICSGQSNMEWPMHRSLRPEESIQAADYPRVRLLSVPRRPAGKPMGTADVRWVECAPDTVRGFSAVGYYFGRHLHKELEVPVGLIKSAWGGTRAETWTPRQTLLARAAFHDDVTGWERSVARYPELLARHRAAVAGAKEEGAKPPKAPPDPVRANAPSTLYNGMIRPLVPYAMKGVIWYQGESNRRNHQEYDLLMRSLITSWREDWGEPFPFLFVQLAPWEPGGESWPALWEQQTKTLGLENTAMAIILDGRPPEDERRDIHPKNKELVGDRLALAARAIAYGEDIVYSGPIYRSMEVEGGKAIISFDHTGGELVTKGGKLEGFVVAGEDGLFVPADAEVRGDRVVVSSPEVTRPVAVRYAWKSWPKATLYNARGLPASPFRTDSEFPIATRFREPR